MDVRFSTADFGDESASLAAAESGVPLQEQYHVFGTVVLEQPGQDPLSIYDDLPFLVLELCVRVPAALAESGEAQVRLIEWPNSFKLEAKGNVVHVTGERGESASFPEAELLPALRDCGRRFAGFLESVAQAAPQFEERAQLLRGETAA